MLLRLLQRNAAGHPDDPAIVEDRHRITHKNLLDRVERLAHGLSAQGIGRGDRVGLYLANSADYVVSFHAVAACRAIVVPIDIECKANELDYYIADAGISLIITDRVRIDRVAKVIAAGRSLKVATRGSNPFGYPTLQELSDTGPTHPLATQAQQDDLTWLYTSGSTARPKCVPRTTGQYVSEMETVMSSLALDETDVIFCSIPLYHHYGAVECMLVSTGSRAKLVILDNLTPFALQRNRALELMEREGVTVIPTVPYVVDQLARGAPSESLASVRLCCAAAAPLSQDTVEAFFARFGIPVFPHYGCTETGTVSIYLPTDTDRKRGSVGKAMPGVEIKIVDDAGNSLAPDETGEIAIRTRSMTHGYRRSDDQDSPFRGGFFHSGDIGHLDKDGHLYLTGRSKFLIDVAGQKFSPMEVEDTLQSHECVDEALVVEMLSARAENSTSRAYVVLSDPCSERELIRFCRDRLASFKVPERIDFVTVVPKDMLGKKLRDSSILEQQVRGAERLSG